MKPGFRQEVLNVVLAQLLDDRGIVSAPENILKLAREREVRMPDVLVRYQGLRTVIEGEVADQAGAEESALGAAQRRVQEGIAHIGIAVVYPAEVRQVEFEQLKDRLAESEMRIAAVTEAGETGFAVGAVEQLEAVLRRSFADLVAEDVVAKAVAVLNSAVESFAYCVEAKRSWLVKLAETLGIRAVPVRGGPETGLTPRSELSPKDADAVSRIAALVLLNAMIFQSVLSADDDRVRAPREMLGDDELTHRFIEHWDSVILQINYYPIFHLASGLLRRFPPNMWIIRELERMVVAAEKIAKMHAALGHDLMGRVYHKLLADAKYLATYYTGIPAATLLLKLALGREDYQVGWHDLDDLRKLRIADLACGTGTLVVAAAEAAVDNYIASCVERGQTVDLIAAHRALVEDVLYGYDVLPSALHLTASTLALRAPDVVFRGMHLFDLPLGGKDKRLGSIEFLEKSFVPVHAALFTEATMVSGLKPTGKEEMLSAPIPEVDLCVMNPPFTRSVGGNLLFGSAPDEERKEMQTRLKKVVGRPSVYASITAGLGSVFVAVADRHLKIGGRIALVLPKAVLSGVAWNETRELFRGRYAVEYIIASHDPLRWNFSESTDLSEVLVVARKTAGNGPQSDDGSFTTAVNLWRNPETNFDALSIVHGLSRKPPADLIGGQGALPVGVGNVKMGEAVRVPWSELRRQYSWLLPCAFAQSDLVRVAHHLINGKLWLPGHPGLHDVPVRPLREAASLGPDCRDIHDGFEPGEHWTPYAAFWGHDCTAVYTLHQTPNRWLSPLPSAKAGRKLRKATDLWPLAGRLLVAERMRLNTQRMAAVYVDEPVLSNVWWPVSLKGQIDQEATSKALAVWLNSTLGLVLLLAHRQETQGAWVKFKKPLLEGMPALDVASLSPEQVAVLTSAYDRLSDESLASFPEMATDRVRAEIDSAVAEAIGLPDLSILRQMLAHEPIVCLRRL